MVPSRSGLSGRGGVYGMVFRAAQVHARRDGPQESAVEVEVTHAVRPPVHHPERVTEEAHGAGRDELPRALTLAAYATCSVAVARPTTNRDFAKVPRVDQAVRTDVESLHDAERIHRVIDGADGHEGAFNSPERDIERIVGDVFSVRPNAAAQ